MPDLHASDLRDRHKGCTLWIAGNGPSLTAEQLERASQDVLALTNNAYLHECFPTLRYDYYLQSDPRGPFRPGREGYREKVVRGKGIYVCTDRLPFEGPNIVKVCLRWVHHGRYAWEHLTDLENEPVNYGGVVFDLGLPLALTIGASRVIFIGVSGYLCGDRRLHFYIEDEPVLCEKEYEAEKLSVISFQEEMKSAASAWMQRCEHAGVEFFNATPESILPIPKGDFA